MNFISISYIGLSIILTVSAQLLLKSGMSSKPVQFALTQDTRSIIMAVLSNMSVVSGLIVYAVSACVWLIVLSKVEVSKAYPFVGIGFVAVMIFAYLFLGEPLTWPKVVGTLLVFSGILVISQ